MEPNQKIYKERRKAWIKALRSGEYKQTKNQLGKVIDGKESYCCLGVACEVAIQLGLKLKKTADEFTVYYGNDHWVSLPKKVQEFYGLQSDNGGFEDIDCLASRNDSGELFKDIADAIEKEPDGLFKD